MGDPLQVAKRPGESLKHYTYLMVGKLAHLSEFLNSGDLPGTKINISLSSIPFFYYSNQCGSGQSTSTMIYTKTLLDGHLDEDYESTVCALQTSCDSQDVTHMPVV